MRVVLINPPHNPDVSEWLFGNYMPPLNLMYLASYLERYGHELFILDLYASPLSFDEIKKRLVNNPPDLIGIATYSSHVDCLFLLTEFLKKTFPLIPIVLGGVHASYLPEVCLARPEVDAVIRGEGEATLADFVNLLSSGQSWEDIDGLSFRRNGRVCHNNDRALIENLDELPWPAYHLIDFSAYRLVPSRAVRHAKVSSILTARGCQYNCAFCSHHYGYQCRVRLRNIVDVFRELVFVRERYGVSEFRFEDCSFTCDVKRTQELCERIRSANMNIVWNCDIRADSACVSLFRAMHAAGCRRVFLGVESGSQEMIDSAGKKGIFLEQVREAVALAKQFKMRITCSFVIGMPGETRETALETLRFAIALDPDYAMFAAFTPSVGSPLFAQAVREGKIDPYSYQGAHFLTIYAAKNQQISMSSLSTKELFELMEKFNRAFYLRPRYYLKRLLGLRSFSEIKFIFWGFLMICRHRFHWAYLLCSAKVNRNK